ncbi:hypothetical protein [Cellulomonas sp. PS-H5]|uniref:hypothetical protein n=1 Tax=Cellulomonas sp. PS-H5 TaxID=2820400 RepID=UPI001C4E7F4F|nr:hypothetical protein [Cellulomonas sp. PS-H5]MBW0254964.1 hypothetical protein [Cellulomonas sp. PS-H5]
MSSEMTPLWGEAVPNWIAAIGGLGGTAVAVAAFVQSLRNRSGLDVVREHENERQNAALEVPERMLASFNEGANDVAPDTGRQVRWEVVRVHRERYALRNTHSSQVATVTRLEGTGRSYADVVPVAEVPAPIEPGADLPFLIARSLASPAVASVQVEWTEDGAGPFTATYLI